jgi:hypothetical protein
MMLSAIGQDSGSGLIKELRVHLDISHTKVRSVSLKRGEEVTCPNHKEVILNGREGSKEGQEVRLRMRKEINAQGQTVYLFYFGNNLFEGLIRVHQLLWQYADCSRLRPVPS